MMAYIAVYSTCFAFTAMETFAYKKSQVWAIICGIFLILFAGLRGDIDCDYAAYKEMFFYANSLFSYHKMLDSFSAMRVEPGYGLFIVICKTISKQSVFLFLGTALLAVSFNIRAFIRYTPLPMLAVLIYASHAYWYKDFITIRAGLASGILLFTIQPLMERRLLRFLLIVGFATTIQMSAAIFLLAWLATRSNFNSRSISVALFISALLGQTGVPVALIKLGLKLNILPQIISIYFEWDIFNYSISLINPTVIKTLLVCFLIIWKRSWVIKSRLRIVICNMYIIGACWLMIMSGFAILAARGAALFFVVEPIIITGIVYTYRKYYFMPIILFVYFCIFVLNLYKLPLEPYKLFTSNHTYSLPIFEEKP